MLNMEHFLSRCGTLSQITGRAVCSVEEKSANTARRQTGNQSNRRSPACSHSGEYHQNLKVPEKWVIFSPYTAKHDQGKLQLLGMKCVFNPLNAEFTSTSSTTSSELLPQFSTCSG